MIDRLAITATSAGLAIALAAVPATAAWWNLGKNGKAPAPETPVIQVQSAGDAERFNRIEEQMRSLTGQVEELTFQLRQLQDQLKRMQEDNEFRFQDLEGGGSTGSRSQGSAESGPGDTAVLAPPAPDEQPDALGTFVGEQSSVMDQLGAPADSLGTLTLDAPPMNGADRPIDLTAPPPMGGTGSADVAMLDPTGDPQSDYERAYSSILNGD
jgi:tol-pal system protein YbgF